MLELEGSRASLELEEPLVVLTLVLLPEGTPSGSYSLKAKGQVGEHRSARAVRAIPGTLEESVIRGRRAWSRCLWAVLFVGVYRSHQGRVVTPEAQLIAAGYTGY